MSLIKPTDTFGNREPPENDTNEQYLFLLEFFIYRVSGERLAKLNGMFFVPTRVSVKFLNFDSEDIAVTPVDLMFMPQSGIGNDVEIFNSGRSVMFAIDRDSVIDKIMAFTLTLTVVKQMPEDMRPDIIVGRGEIDMSKHFAALRKEMLQCWQTNYPPPKIYEGNVDLFHDDRLTGSVEIYVRISGFGQSIVTEIETPRDDENTTSYVFKSMENNDKQLAYTCRLISSSKMDFCKDSRENLNVKDACPVCMSKRHDCSTCGVIGGAVKKHTSFVNDERSGGEPDEALKTILHGKVFTQPWEPTGRNSGEPRMSRENPKIQEFHEKTHYQGLPIQSSRGPTELCGKAVILKVSGLLDVENADGRRKDPTVTLIDESQSMKDNVEPEHDIFILRIGKKGLVGEGEKSDIQLEMRTPKGPERRPPIRYETREMQTDEDIVEVKSRRESKAKGKVKNSKKKKKKK